MAGGLTENANTTVINLSKKITDEMVIIIYSNKEVKDFKKTKELEASLIAQCKQKDANSLENGACIDGDNKTSKDSNSKVNINSATKEELMTLTGIGEAKADDIINYRNSNGPFSKIEDIKNIKGIGDAIFDKIKDRLTL
ncbi:MAG: helix-hairpin-helix domain-containing protein [Bacilli bacterium]|nr:helix-hairpin-helix domain-containing protein [Bacilli bacterium]